MTFVTLSHKRVTKSLGRSRGSCRKHPYGSFLSISCFWFFFSHIVWRLYYHIRTVHSLCWRLNDFQTHFNSNYYFDYSSVNLSSSIFSKWPFCYRLTLGGHNFTWARPDITVMVDWALKTNNQSINQFTLALCTVLKLLSNYCSSIALSTGISNSE